MSTKKQLSTRIASFLLTMLMVITAAPVTVISAESSGTADAQLIVDNVFAMPGETVEMNITLKNAPTVKSMSISNITFDTDKMTLTNVEWICDAEIKNWNQLQGRGVLAFSENTDANGTVVKLTFEINKIVDDADVNVMCAMSLKRMDDADNEIPVPVSIISGSVTIRNAIRGDMDANDKLNSNDAVYLLYYVMFGKDDYPIRQNGDMDGNGKVNSNDAVYLLYHVMFGEEDYPLYEPCAHALQHVAAKAMTCTVDGNIEYWSCTKCGKCFSDSAAETVIALEDTIIKAAHNEIYIEAVPATPTSEGYKAGVWCDKCETWLSGHDVIPPIKPDESNISYRHYVQRENSFGNIEIVSDDYLSTHEIVNPNPVTYIEGVGVAELIEGVDINGKKVSSDGYSFLGWYEKPEPNAERVYSISAEARGDKILYGIWSKNVYKITYLPDSASSTLPRVEDGSFTVDKETSLKEPPEWKNLVWVGWSNDNGEIVKSIPKGTTGDITLTANWMSKRSQTVPNTKYASTNPAIVADEENGVYAFTYEIGDIQNVPIQQVEEGAEGKGFNLVKGMTHEINKTFTQKIGQGEATNIANTIANATTKSDSWTLSEDWNKSTTFSQEHSNEISEEQSQKSAISYSKTNKFSLSSGVGGSKEHINESGTSTKTTSKNEFGVSLNAGVKTGLKASVTKGTPFKNASVEGSVGLDYKHSKETEKETHETHTDKSSSYWNINAGFESSKTKSESKEFAQSISQSIKDTYSYGETLDFGGSQSNTVSSSNTSSESREYSSSVTYSTEEGKSITVSETLTADAETGFYRKVLAANFKVFAVVIYDMKTNTFSTMTYSLKINDSEHLFTDYSTVSSFNDYENGILPFEVPSFVSDYVYGLVGASEGLRVDDETGVVESYGFKDPATGICYKKYDEFTNSYSNPCDTDVIIPRYRVVNVSNNQKKIVPVTGISASAFAGTNVTSIYLSDNITEIPNGAFENCMSLKYVRGGSITTIGKGAFKNCTSLFESVLPDTVTNLDEGAFENVTALTVNVSNSSVLDAALNSGVKSLTVDLTTMTDSIDGKKIVTPETMEYFCIRGGGKTYNNVSLDSDANTVVLNNLTIKNSADLPLKLTGANVELSFATINAGSLLMRLDADKTHVTLDGNNYLVSSGNNAILCKNVRFLEKEGSSATGKLRITGNVLVYGAVNGVQHVSFDSAAYNFVYLTDEEYAKMLNSHYVFFNANGGTVDTENKLIMWNSQIGELPVPTRNDCTFIGWYKTDGTQITEDTVFTELEDITVKAYWISGWVTADSLPENASIDAEKWTYTLREYTEQSTDSYSGWTKYDTKRTSWGTTQGPVYSNPSNGYRNVWSEQYVASTTTHYTFYHRYGWGYNTSTGKNSYVWGSDSQLGSGERHEIDLIYDLSKSSNFAGNSCWKGYTCPHCGQANVWLGRSTYVAENKADRWYYQEPVYTYYYYRDVSQEAMNKPDEQENISNVQKWVKYIVK